jgi:type I restriction enzyme R subunit
MKRKRHYRGGYQFAGLLELARTLRKEETSAESVLWEVLRDRQLLGFKFRRQHQFGNYVADFFCQEAAVAIECDGAIHQKDEQWHHDQIRDAFFAGEGIVVLRFSNEQILNDTASVVEEIARHLPSPSGRGR